jgi:hypothetical protein
MVSVSRVHVPAALVVTVLVCPAGAERIDVAFVPPQFVQGTLPPGEYVQPPWMATLVAGRTTCSS